MSRISTAAFLVLALAGLLQAQDPLKADPGVGGVLAGYHQVAKAPPTEEDLCRTWALALERSVKSGDGAFLYNALDWPILSLKIIPSKKPELFSSGLLTGLHESLRQQGENLCSEVAHGGDYRLMAIRRPAHNWKALFRFLSAKGTFNYHEFELSIGRNGRVTATDVYIAMTGETLADTMGRIVRFAVQERQTNSKDLNKAVEVFKRQAQLVKEGKKEEATKVLDDLPVSVKKEKWVMVGRLMGSTGSDPKHFMALLEEAQKRFPHDASLDLLSISYWLEHKDFDHAFKALAGLRAFAGSDAFLDVYEARLLTLKGELQEASIQVRRAIAKEPDLKLAYWTKIDIDLGLLDFPAVADALTTLEKKLGTKLPDLTKVAVYGLFVKSEAYEAWMKTRAAS